MASCARSIGMAKAQTLCPPFLVERCTGREQGSGMSAWQTARLSRWRRYQRPVSSPIPDCRVWGKLSRCQRVGIVGWTHCRMKAHLFRKIGVRPYLVSRMRYQKGQKRGSSLINSRDGSRGDRGENPGFGGRLRLSWPSPPPLAHHRSQSYCSSCSAVGHIGTVCGELGPRFGLQSSVPSTDPKAAMARRDVTAGRRVDMCKWAGFPLEALRLSQIP
ncbi:hypothetical protein N656DRAFT_121305 [Canariomyces notabilis]|uniref:Uncharacterized protein n=1 Tax=Canariomyces notabilis TaxID=2074819 RepID=A0AAN6TCF5_9PEZI|nr:hypothetical protein N656DRAFT_121305 [Canariomyces arenarius]